MEVLSKPIRFLIFLVLLGVFLYFGKDVLVPFCIAGLLSMLFLPIARYLESRKWNRALASLAPVLLLVIVCAGIAGLLFWQIADIADDASQIEQRISSFADNIRSKIEDQFGISQSRQKEILKESSSGGGGQIASVLTSAVSSFFGIAVDTMLILVYIFLLIYFRGHLKKFFLQLAPPDKKDTTASALSKATKVAGQYLSGLFLMIVMLWVLYAIGFSLAGVKYPFFFALLCGLLEIVPFVGNVTGTTLTIIVNMAQGGDGTLLLLIILVYGTIQFIQSYLLEPLVVGAGVNINPLMTIFGLVVGEAVWGIGGMLLAIPLMGIIKIICDHIPQLKPYGFLLGNNNKDEGGNWVTRLRRKFSKSKSSS